MTKNNQSLPPDKNKSIEFDGVKNEDWEKELENQIWWEDIRLGNELRCKQFIKDLFVKHEVIQGLRDFHILQEELAKQKQEIIQMGEVTKKYFKVSCENTFLTTIPYQDGYYQAISDYQERIRDEK